VRIPAGKKLVVYFSSTSLAQDQGDALYLAAVQPGAQITIGRATLQSLGADEGNLPMMRALLAVAAAALLAVPAAGARPADTPGVTSTQIVLGATGPLSGAESQYEPVLSGAQAYFSYVNDHGGVLGRTIEYKVEDDHYDPAQTVALTQKLVEQEKVFAIFNSVGTRARARGPPIPQRPEDPAALRRHRRRDDRLAAQAVPVDDRAAAEQPRRGRHLRTSDRRDEAQGEDRRAL